MQLMNTIFLLITTIINKIDSEIKIINSIFNFHIKEQKMNLKLPSFKDNHLFVNLNNKDLFSKKPINGTKHHEVVNKSKANNIITKINDISNISLLNISNISINKKFNESQKSEMIIDNISNIINFENKKGKIKKEIKKTAKKSLNHNISDYLSNPDNITKEFNENINLNIFSYFCRCKNSEKNKLIKLYNKAISFFREKMDIVKVFSIQLIIEDLIKNNNQ